MTSIPAARKKSTNVRYAVATRMLRVGYLLGGWLMPRATVRHATGMFGTPRPASRRRAAAADSSDATIGQVRCGTGVVTTYAWGDPATQPCVLMVHGWSGFGLGWRPWVAPLRAAGYAVLAFDQPAHGRNAAGRPSLPGFAAAVAAVVEAHGPPAAVVAHSMGASAALLAMVDGVRSERVVLVAPAADLRAAALRFGQATGLAPWLVERMLQGFERTVGVAVDSLAAHLHAPSMGAAALVVHDLEDREVPWEEGERYARLWPHARLLSTRGLGHHRIVADPAVMAAALRFLQGEAVGERVVSSPNLRLGFQ